MRFEESCREISETSKRSARRAHVECRGRRGARAGFRNSESAEAERQRATGEGARSGMGGGGLASFLWASVFSLTTLNQIIFSGS